MKHRTRLIQVTGGYAGICSCGYATGLAHSITRDRASIEINDHELAALRDGVKITHLEPAPEIIKKR